MAKISSILGRTFQNASIILHFLTPMFEYPTATEELMPYGLLYLFEGDEYLIEVVIANML